MRFEPLQHILVEAAKHFGELERDRWLTVHKSQKVISRDQVKIAVGYSSQAHIESVTGKGLSYPIDAVWFNRAGEAEIYLFRITKGGLSTSMNVYVTRLIAGSEYGMVRQHFYSLFDRIEFLAIQRRKSAKQFFGGNGVTNEIPVSFVLGWH